MNAWLCACVYMKGEGVWVRVCVYACRVVCTYMNFPIPIEKKYKKKRVSYKYLIFSFVNFSFVNTFRMACSLLNPCDIHQLIYPLYHVYGWLKQKDERLWIIAFFCIVFYKERKKERKMHVYLTKRWINTIRF